MTRKPKPEQRHIIHKIYGRVKVRDVRELDSGGGVYVADIEFEDRRKKTIRLEEHYWESGIESLLPKPPRANRSPASPIEAKQAAQEIMTVPPQCGDQSITSCVASGVVVTATDVVPVEQGKLQTVSRHWYHHPPGARFSRLVVLEELGPRK